MTEDYSLILSTQISNSLILFYHFYRPYSHKEVLSCTPIVYVHPHYK